MLDPHFGRALNIPLSRAYEYYKDIEDYVQRYPRYYGSIDVIDKTDNSITTRQFLNLSISVDQDHVKVDVRYTFFPLKEIQYEIIRGYDEGAITNSIRFTDQDKAKGSSKCFIEVSHVPLDIICYPPHSIGPGTKGYEDYQKMIDYFVEQDLVQLENKAKGFRVGAKCPKCNKGTLQNTGKREIGERRETEFFECDYCKSQFQSFRAEV